MTFGLADNAAKARGMETFAQHANRFREGKGWLGYHLFRLLQDANGVRLEEISKWRARSFQTETWRSEPSPPGAGSDGRQRFGKLWSLPLGLSPMKTSRHASSACSRADRTTKKCKRHLRIEHERLIVRWCHNANHPGHAVAAELHVPPESQRL